MFIARNPGHLVGNGHRYQTTTEAVVIQLQTVNKQNSSTGGSTRKQLGKLQG